MTIDGLLREGSKILSPKEDARLEAEVLLAAQMGKERVWLHIHGNQVVNLETEELFRSSIMALKNHTPLQYLTGVEEWMGLSFKVTEDTLIPREDTRVLLEEILERIPGDGTGTTLIEVGTGTGILPVLIQKNRPFAVLHVTELNPKTLEVARENFARHGVSVTAHQTDFLLAIKEEGIHGDILFSNPPYISTMEYEALDPSVRKEPSLALWGGADGLEPYRRLAKEYEDVLNPGGYLLVEIGWKQGEDVRSILESTGLRWVKTAQDDAGRDRTIVMRFGGHHEDQNL